MKEREITTLAISFFIGAIGITAMMLLDLPISHGASNLVVMLLVALWLKIREVQQKPMSFLPTVVNLSIGLFGTVGPIILKDRFLF